jgi:YVTN family beta-propeller protein
MSRPLRGVVVSSRIAFSALVLVIPVTSAQPLQSGPAFRNYESAPVHPIRVSSDGARLYAVNTPDNRLEVHGLSDPANPVLLRDIPVGLEPVSVTPRTADEVWVANVLGDCVSVVSVSKGCVVATVRVSDEPCDVAFAGPYAFVSASASDEVHVFDAATRAFVTKIAIPGKDPRALAVQPGGGAVYVLVHRSGNGTSVIPENLAPPPPPPQNTNLPAAPSQGIIVRANDPAWQGYVTWTQPDKDIVEISVATLSIVRSVSAVGTTLFDFAVDPVGGELYVANTEARNLVRFEANVRGHVIDSRVTRVAAGPNPAVVAWDLNPGFTYTGFPNLAERALALAEPTGIALDASAGRIYVAAQGTDRIGVLDRASGAVLARIEVGTASGSTVDTANKRGPRGLALHPSAPRLYVHNRLSQSISVIDTAAGAVIREVPLAFDPTPVAIRQGRKFQYEAKHSGSGATSCAACHVDADIDALAWDLGDPSGTMLPAPTQPFPFNLGLVSYHPMKGPMTTQTLRGLDLMSPFHWRGEKPTLASFNAGFPGVLGAPLLAQPDLDLYVAFLGSMEFPPNPQMNLDRTLKTAPAATNQAAGKVAFQQDIGGGLSCAACHALPNGSNRMVIAAQTLNEPQQQKVPQLRNLYRKNGLAKGVGVGKAGFGFTHDGVVDSLATFLALPVFNSWPSATKDDIVEFLLAFDTGTAPAVGRQATVDATNASSPSTLSDISLLESQATLGNCGVVVKGVLDGVAHGLAYSTSNGSYTGDGPGIGPWTSTQLRTQAASGAVTWTFLGVPPGSSTRIGVDRDSDGALDGAEGIANLGGATAGCQGEPLVFANGEPRIGNSAFAVVCANVPPLSSGRMLVQAKTSSIPGAPFNGSLVLSSDSHGFAWSSQPIPNSPALAGRTARVQFRFRDACAPNQRLASDVLQVTIRP